MALSMKDVFQRLLDWLKGTERRFVFAAFGFAGIAVAALVVFGFIGGEKVDLRSAVPRETLAFVHARDVGAVYGLIAKNSGSNGQGISSYLDGVEIAVALTGFETSEQELTESASVLNVRPKFAAVAKTNAWSWQVSSLIDGPLNDFIVKEYGNGVIRGKRSARYGDFEEWTSADGRKAYAAAFDDLIFFGNDLDSIEQCLAAKRGEQPSLIEDQVLTDFVSEYPDSEVIGYFPKRAVKKFADVAGVSAAVSGSKQEGIRAFVARLVPQILRSSVEEVFWTSKNRDGFFEDRISFVTNQAVSEVISETMKPGNAEPNDLIKYLPANTASVTRYNLRNPRISYRSLMVLAAKNADPASGRLIAAVSGSLLEPYGVADAEKFLESTGSELLTVQTNGASDASVAIVSVKDGGGLVGSLVPEIGVQRKAIMLDGMELWTSTDNSSMSAAIGDKVLIIGDTDTVLSSLKKEGRSAAVTKKKVFDSLINSEALAATISLDEGEYDFLNKARNRKNYHYLSETSFSKRGVIRRYQSRFGLIGSLVSDFGS